ncbi:NAD-dependent epimerase/dehydratase family protein [Nonomuraea rhodomycinica]|uniref:NAD-dependent epimerase/dehydratase family protein n=1 Tax=Nonomuraea rhodomycinica TaxID=1712872 RepID=A0A7Y6MFR4_9ACTN|nr:NAD-dependent epimerase/dehydratase family protein [Nonomuraea rhodomycinica]NUW44941.1 NAD-dependent epimerase/dehydratase family protein [Nonomuraea rhodomycinica]
MSGSLVTGATGFIGSRLLRGLGAAGEAHGVSRSPRPRAPGVVWHQVDLRDAAAVEKLFAAVRPEVVHHLAGEVDGARELDVVLPTLTGNLTSTVNVLAAAARSGSRVVLAGSSEEPRPGNGHAAPPSPYAMAKAAASGYADLFHRLWGVPCTIVRPTMVYGPGQRDGTKLVPYVTLSLLRGEEPRLTSGAKVADWVYVDDVVEAFAAAGAGGRAVGHALDVGTGVRTPVREVVELLYRIVGAGGEPRFGTVADRPLDVPQSAETGPARELLGWEARVGLEEGLRRTVAWYAARQGVIL